MSPKSPDEKLADFLEEATKGPDSQEYQDKWNQLLISMRENVGAFANRAMKSQSNFGGFQVIPSLRNPGGFCVEYTDAGGNTHTMEFFSEQSGQLAEEYAEWQNNNS